VIAQVAFPERGWLVPCGRPIHTDETDAADRIRARRFHAPEDVRTRLRCTSIPSGHVGRALPTARLARTRGAATATEYPVGVRNSDSSHAARPWYSWMSPPNRSRRRTSACARNRRSTWRSVALDAFEWPARCDHLPTTQNVRLRGGTGDRRGLPRHASIAPVLRDPRSPPAHPASATLRAPGFHPCPVRPNLRNRVVGRRGDGASRRAAAQRRRRRCSIH
jgi:hypothetical protein